MNNGRIWCVVNPSVGLPLFLGGVATIALIVHASVLSNTTWMANYWQGSSPRKAQVETTTQTVAAQVPADAPYTVNVMPVSGLEGTTAFVVTITPRTGGTVQAVSLVQRADPPPDLPPPAATR
ncbi:MAG: light-harvesting protein [Acetobacteraceae bacterium]